VKPEDVAVGVLVRLTVEGQTRRLWAGSSRRTAVVREVKNIGGVSYAIVGVDGERLARVRTMRPEWLELAT
jgi:hypothetical protein